MTLAASPPVSSLPGVVRAGTVLKSETTMKTIAAKLIPVRLPRRSRKPKPLELVIYSPSARIAGEPILESGANLKACFRVHRFSLDPWNVRKCVLYGLEQLLARERLWEKKAICRLPKNLSRGWLIRCRHEQDSYSWINLKKGLRQFQAATT